MDEKRPKEAPPAKGQHEREREREAVKRPAEQEQPPPPRKNTMLFAGIITGIIALELAVGIVIVKVAMPRAPDEIEARSRLDSLRQLESETTAMGPTTAEKPIEVVVNIAGTDGERYLKAAVVLEYTEKAEKKSGKAEALRGGETALGNAIVERMPKYKSWLIERLSRMTLAEVSAQDAKERIRKELLRFVNSTLPPDLGEVKDIYFTQFIIQ